MKGTLQFKIGLLASSIRLLLCVCLLKIEVMSVASCSHTHAKKIYTSLKTFSMEGDTLKCFPIFSRKNLLAWSTNSCIAHVNNYTVQIYWKKNWVPVQHVDALSQIIKEKNWLILKGLQKLEQIEYVCVCKAWL